MTQQSLTADIGWIIWKNSFKEESSGTKTMSQIFKILFCAAIMLKNSSTCNFPLCFLT